MKALWERLLAFPARALMFLVWGYRRFLSPLKPRSCCRFSPSCSQYALDALRIHGACRGVVLIVWRLLRCHPFYHGNLYDPVPPRGRE